MNTTTTQGDWQITKIQQSRRNGRYYVHGVNHCTTDPLAREFFWHIQDLEPRFYMTADTEISPRAAVLLARDAK